MKIGVVIPWRDSGDQERRDNFNYVKNYYEEFYDVVVASDGKMNGSFNRSAAYNRGYSEIVSEHDSDVIVWNEADTIIPFSSIELAAVGAAESLGIVVPYTERHELSKQATDSVLNGSDPFGYSGQVVHGNGWSIGQAGVTSIDTMDAIGGLWDESFSGWGYDDNAMFTVFEKLAGPARWVRGLGIHLYHVPAYEVFDEESRARTDKNQAIYERILSMSREELVEHLGKNGEDQANYV